MNMKIRYDQEVDALSIIFRETTVTTQLLAEGITGEYDENGRLAGLEVLDVMKRFGDVDTLRQVILEGIGPSASPVRRKRLRTGHIGTVVHIYKGGAGYEVEFMTVAGETVAVVTLMPSQLRPFARRDLAHVRELTAM
jgi:uncharacterized protein YuzE